LPLAALLLLLLLLLFPLLPPPLPPLSLFALPRGAESSALDMVGIPSRLQHSFPHLTRSPNNTNPEVPTQTHKVVRVRATFNFEGLEEDELSLPKGLELVATMREVAPPQIFLVHGPALPSHSKLFLTLVVKDDNWLWGQHPDGRLGIFPLNFVTVLGTVSIRTLSNQPTTFKPTSLPLKTRGGPQ